MSNASCANSWPRPDAVCDLAISDEKSPAATFTRFIDRPGFTIEPGDMGFMDRAIGPPAIFNQKQIAWDRARYGGGRAFDVVVNAAIEGGPSDLSDEDPVGNPGDQRDHASL
jgi:hypothetical protein